MPEAGFAWEKSKRMTTEPTVIRADLEHLQILAPLFDAYRVFYEQASDLPGAREYLRQRLSNLESAIFLALVGLYGVQSSLVSRRRREIGIRMALGAEASGVVTRVVRSGVAMGGLGVLIGIVAALALSGVVRGILFGVSPTDPLILITMPALLLVASFLASLIPALRASRVNPVEALREE